MIITRRLRLITRHFGQRRLTLADTFMRLSLVSLHHAESDLANKRTIYRAILLQMRQLTVMYMLPTIQSPWMPHDAIERERAVYHKTSKW